MRPFKARFRCPKCGSLNQECIDSGGNQAGTRLYRRHQCVCGERFTSHAFIGDAELERYRRDSELLERLRRVLASPVGDAS